VDSDEDDGQELRRIERFIIGDGYGIKPTAISNVSRWEGPFS